jgi:uncharacterized protein (TIGR00288 family)
VAEGSRARAVARGPWRRSAGADRIEHQEGQAVIEMASESDGDRTIAMFVDFENLALGVREAKFKKFDIHLVLERLVEKGRIIVRRAYADWERYSDYKRALHECAIELIEIPQRSIGGKNSADIRLVVDAMDLCYGKAHVDAFAILSGDSDFSPLVAKLRENDKYVIGLGVKQSTSDLLAESCDEFIFYDDLARREEKRGPEHLPPRLQALPKKKAEAFLYVLDAIQALLRENKNVLWGSMLKETVKRKRPFFDENYHGYSTFSKLLEDAEKEKLVQLKRDEKSGGYIITAYADDVL